MFQNGLTRVPKHLLQSPKKKENGFETPEKKEAKQQFTTGNPFKQLPTECG